MHRLERTPEARIDLGTKAGTELAKAHWRYSDTKIVEVDFNTAGADGQPSAVPNQTYDITPQARRAEFDDSKWEIIEPTTLDRRRGNGKLAFNWYRIKITVPERIGSFDTKGSTIVFSTSLDDYAEIWVDGELPRAAGQSGGSVIKGWNAENRLAIVRGVKPGQAIQLAIFGANGPLSQPPTNYIWMRYARLEFHKISAGPVAVAAHEVNVNVDRIHPAIDAIVPRNPKIFKLAEGFQFTEGPIWTQSGDFLFSDPNANRIYKYSGDGKLSIFKSNSGYTGKDIGEYDGRQHLRRGVVAAVRLHDFRDGAVLPHEGTLAAPKADPLELLKAVRANLSPVFGLYQDERNQVQAALAGALAAEPVGEADSSDGVHHRLWRVEDPVAVAAVQRLLADQRVLIADGHHRYSAALGYRDLVDAAEPGLPPDAGHRWVLMFLCSTSDPGLLIFPTHRAVSGLRDFRAAGLAARLERLFRVETIAEDVQDPLSLARILCFVPWSFPPATEYFVPPIEDYIAAREGYVWG